MREYLKTLGIIVACVVVATAATSCSVRIRNLGALGLRIPAGVTATSPAVSLTTTVLKPVLTGTTSTMVGGCDSFLVTLKDGSGAAAVSATVTTVYLISGGIGIFYFDSACLTDAMTIDFQPGEGSKTVYYRNDTAMNEVLLVTTDEGEFSSISVRTSDSGQNMDDYRLPGIASGLQTRSLYVAPDHSVYSLAEVDQYSSYGAESLVQRSTDGGSTWSIVDRYSYPSSGSNYPAHITGDLSGNLYVGVNSNLQGRTHWVVRKSSDGGATWADVDDYVYRRTRDDQLSFLFAAPLGVIYAFGYGYETSGAPVALVRRSSDYGAHWATVYSKALSDSSESIEFKSVVADASGRLIALQNYSDLAGVSHSLTLESTDFGVHWNTIDDDSNPNGVWWTSLTIDSAGTLFALGGDDNSSWVVRSSVDGGHTWVNRDSTPAQGVQIQSIGVGTLIATGYDQGSSEWLVRKSVDSGATWAEVDRYAYLGTRPTAVSAIAHDSGGKVYVMGSALDVSNQPHLLIRKSTDSGSAWADLTDFSPMGFKPTSAEGIYFSGSDIYVAGGSDAGAGFGMIRKSSDGGNSWTTVLSVSNGGKISGITGSGSNIYSAGSGACSWEIRKSTDAGATWNVVDSVCSQYSIQKILVDASGRIFVLGFNNNGMSIHPWFLRMSTDGGSTWSTILNASPAGALNWSYPSAVAVNSAGEIFVLGVMGDASYNNYLHLMKSSNGGTSWSVVVAADLSMYNGDLYIDAADRMYIPVDWWKVKKSSDGGTTWSTNTVLNGYISGPMITGAPNGDLYTWGEGDALSLLVYKSSDAGVTWSLVANVSYDGRWFSYGNAIRVDSSNHVWIAGKMSEANSVDRWIVRKY